MPLVQKLASELWEVRSSISAVLDPSNASVSLQTLERAALAVGQKLKIQLV